MAVHSWAAPFSLSSVPPPPPLCPLLHPTPRLLDAARQHRQSADLQTSDSSPTSLPAFQLSLPLSPPLDFPSPSRPSSSLQSGASLPLHHHHSLCHSASSYCQPHTAAVDLPIIAGVPPPLPLPALSPSSASSLLHWSPPPPPPTSHDDFSPLHCHCRCHFHVHLCLRLSLLQRRRGSTEGVGSPSLLSVLRRQRGRPHRWKGTRGRGAGIHPTTPLTPPPHCHTTTHHHYHELDH